MFRALSTRRGNGYGYDRLVDESTTDLLNGAKLSRSKTVASPARFFKKSTPDWRTYSAKSPIPEYNIKTKVWTPEHKYPAKVSPPKADIQAKYAAKEAKKASKIHPLFSLFEKSSRKKATAKPEFARYMEYLKEGGTGAWDSNTGKPVLL